METSQTGICTSNLTIMRNFHDLLIFWQDHYLHKDKDCSALEKVITLQIYLLVSEKMTPIVLIYYITCIVGVTFQNSHDWGESTK